MAGFARRVAPAAALGGLAVVIVGIADPAIASLRASDDASTTGLAASAATTTQGSTPGSTDTGSGTQTRNRGGQSDGSSSHTTTSGGTTSDGSTSGSSGSADTSASCSSGQTVTGDSVMTRWGPVQVAATVDNGTVCEVRAIAWPNGDGRSQQISAYAIPYLDQSATASQGTRLDYVSGATYTSDGYAQSLQSILDQL